MRNLLSSACWILLLAVAALFLLFYNFGYVPKLDRVNRQQQEINMWTSQVQELSDSLRRVLSRGDTLLHSSMTFDELYGGADNFQLMPRAESALKALVPSLQSTTGPVVVVGHTDNAPVPQKLRDQCPTNWEHGAARAAAVARALLSWGVSSTRVSVVSFGDTRPVGSNATASGRASNRRVEVVVLSK